MKIMAEHDIEDRDAFIEWAKGFDHDENKYLKTSEIQDAAQGLEGPTRIVRSWVR